MRWTDILVELACRYKRSGVILNYHTLSAAQMREQIELWSRHFEFIHHEEMAARLARPGNKPFCLVTFDDGKKSNLTETAPVLAHFGVPAVFYIVTRFASGELPELWFDTYRRYLARTGDMSEGLRDVRLKRMPHGERFALLERHYQDRGYSRQMPSAETAAMSWEDIRELRLQGHAIGAHSETHPILTTMPAAQAMGEIERSIARVSAELGEPCPSFAFPNGNHTEELARYAFTCGVRTVMTTDPAWMGSAEQPWRLPRIQIYPTQTATRHKLKLFLAAFGRLLKNPDGTGRHYVRARRASALLPNAALGWPVQTAPSRTRTRQADGPTALGTTSGD